MSIKLKLSQQGNLLKGKIISDKLSPRTGGGVRGKCADFSPRSRKNLIDKLSSLDGDKIKDSGVAFLTLTYAQKYPSFKRAKLDLRNFFAKVERKTKLDLGFVWRIEPQKRGAPHFHILIFGWNKTEDGWPLTHEDFKSLWSSCVDYSCLDFSGIIPRSPIIEISFIRSFKKLMYYVSKYVAKYEKSSGGMWHTEKSRSDFESAALPQSVILVNSSNRSAFWSGCFGDLKVKLLNSELGIVKKEYNGRSWGMENKENIPFGDLDVSEYELDDGIGMIVNILSFKFRNIKPREFQGFTIHDADAKYWFDRFPDFADYKGKFDTNYTLSELHQQCKAG